MYCITVIYSFFTFLTGLGIYTTIARAGPAREDLLRLYSTSDSLLIQGFTETAGSINFYIAAYLLVTIGGYIGSILFLMYSLRRSSRAK
jgi:hypothetical protein